MKIMIKKERFSLIELDDHYLYDYFIEFNDSITQYQYLDPFDNEQSVKDYFDMSRYEQSLNYCLHYLIVDDKEFIGSLIVHNLQDDYPEIGIWIKSSRQKEGIGKEVINSLFDYLFNFYHKTEFVFSIDIRNTGSLSLLKYFDYQFAYHDQLINETGKILEADVFLVKKKNL